MSDLKNVSETCVATGIRAYISLLGYGETRRSRMIFRDILKLSAALAGGPSSSVSALSWRNDFEEPGPLQQSLVRASVSSLLASLFVLRTTIYWQKIPVLEAFLDACCFLADHSGDSRNFHGTTKAELRRCASCGKTRCDCDDPDQPCGCRRNRTLPTGPVCNMRCPSGQQLELIGK